MKLTLALVFSVVALLAALVALVRSGSSGAAQETARYEVAVPMGRMQRFADKLYFAGQAGNWPLAQFYVHEIHETVEEVINANVVDEGVAVSSFMRQMFPPALARMEEVVRARKMEQFMPAYEGLLISCNSCHQSTGHGFVKIMVPAKPSYENQDFRP